MSLIENDGSIVLTIKDDGMGFMDDSQNVIGIGLKIMKCRAHMMDASFQVKPNLPGKITLTRTTHQVASTFNNFKADSNYIL